ncbi:MAG: formate-dependent phosphoribosylglycinamide formyltransferase [Pseudobdellovibrionaceae bacterium]
MQLPKKILLLGSGELGKEFVISAQRLGLEVMAVDRYSGAPAQQVAHHFRVIDMLDGEAISKVVHEFNPDYIVPEIEAIRTSELLKLEKEGFRVVPSAYATHLTMNRDEIRNLASEKLKLRTAHFAYATSSQELLKEAEKIGFPVVIKPVMSSSGKGQSVAKTKADIDTSWDYAVANKRGDQNKVIVEEFIDFDYEITLLTIKQLKGPTLYAPVIGHRQERGDYQESWQPVRMSPKHLKNAQKMAKKVTDALGGSGLFGVEFFVTKKEVIFSELSPRPHDTGMVTLISQNLTEFDLHLRAILGLPIQKIEAKTPSASAVILASETSADLQFMGLEKALKVPTADIRIFGKPDSRPYRRMGVALAQGKTLNEARKRAKKAAQAIQIIAQK